MKPKTRNQVPKAENEVAEILGVHQPSLTRKGWLGLSLLLVSVAVTLLAWVRSDNASVPSYRTQPVERGSLVVTVTATGTLEPINQVDVGSELSGIIETVGVDHNDSVQVGQVLAKLDTDRLKAQVLESRAALESAEAKVLDTEATVTERRLALDRARELVEKALSPQSELDAAEAAMKRAQADLASARAQVSQAKATLGARETELGKTVIRSPIRGIVLDRNVEPGQTVAASLQSPVLFTLAEDLSEMELHVAVDEADVGYVSEGQEATFTVDAHPYRSFPAKITQLRYASETVDGVVTYEAVLRVDNSDLLLRPGMTATAEIVVETVEDTLLVPNAALRFEPPKQREGSSQRSGSLLSAILPRRPAPERSRKASKETGGQRIWILEEGRPVAVSIVTGATDGQMSQVVAGNVEPGLALLVDIESRG
jgi:HlyD family secretion protein